MVKFKHTTPMLKASNIQATVEFYTDLLGFNVDMLWPENKPTLCELSKEDVRIMFDVGADWDSPGASPSVTGQLVFDVSDVSTLHENLKSKVEVLWGPEVYAYGRREFSIKDPNGYRLVFSEITSDPVTCEG